MVGVCCSPLSGRCWLVASGASELDVHLLFVTPRVNHRIERSCSHWLGVWYVGQIVLAHGVLVEYQLELERHVVGAEHRPVDAFLPASDGLSCVVFDGVGQVVYELTHIVCLGIGLVVDEGEVEQYAVRRGVSLREQLLAVWQSEGSHAGVEPSRGEAVVVGHHTPVVQLEVARLRASPQVRHLESVGHTRELCLDAAHVAYVLDVHAHIERRGHGPHHLVARQLECIAVVVAFVVVEDEALVDHLWTDGEGVDGDAYLASLLHVAHILVPAIALACLGDDGLRVDAVVAACVVHVDGVAVLIDGLVEDEQLVDSRVQAQVDVVEVLVRVGFGVAELVAVLGQHEGEAVWYVAVVLAVAGLPVNVDANLCLAVVVELQGAPLAGGEDEEQEAEGDFCCGKTAAHSGGAGARCAGCGGSAGSGGGGSAGHRCGKTAAHSGGAGVLLFQRSLVHHRRPPFLLLPSSHTSDSLSFVGPI